MARVFHTDLSPGDVLVIPAGASATVTLEEKSGRRSRLRIESDEPVTITRASQRTIAPAGTAGATSPIRRIARRPVPTPQ